jgi:hypothetical protein
MYDYTTEEYEKTIKNYFKDGKITVFPSKERKKYIMLQYFITLFEENIEYGEKQVNEIIKKVYPNFSTIRRYLVDYKMLNRTDDCKKYWLEK